MQPPVDVEIRILGPVEIVVGGSAVRVASAPARAVLATLALRSGVLVRTEDLIDMVWGAAAPRTALNQLQIAVYRLRRAISSAGIDPQTVFVTHPSGYQLASASVHVDLTLFRSLTTSATSRAAAGDWLGAGAQYAEALALWRGWACEDATAERIRAAASLLDGERTDVIERKLAVDLLADRPISTDAAALVVADPLRERLWFLLVLGHAIVGRQAEALAAYQRARVVLADELGLEPGLELKELEGLVLRGDLSEGTAIVRSWFGAPVSPPARRIWQIPADIADFTARRREVARIVELLTARATYPATVCISGMGGMGKTTLAVRVAHELERQTAACVFVDLHGSDAAPSDPHLVMGSILRSLGLPGSSVPEDRDSRAGLYLSELAARRPLLVLDNAADERQVRPLIPGGAGCRTLITSRRTLAGLDGVHLIELQVLAESDAVALLETVAGPQRTAHEPEAARKLAELCGGLPLAVRIIGVRLARRTGTSLQRMVDRLAGEHSRLDELTVGDREVRAVFAVSQQRIDRQSALLLRRIGLLPVPEAANWAAAAMLDKPVPEADRSLDRLAEASLATTWDTGDEARYRLHDLVQLYAREQTDDTDVSALRRAYEALLQLAVRADEALPIHSYPTSAAPDGWYSVEPNQPIRQPFQWFETERALLLRAARDAADRGWPDVAWRLVCSMTNFGMRQAYVQEWSDVAVHVLSTMDSEAPQGDDEGAAALLLGLGMMRQSRGHALPARAALRQARRAYLRLGDVRRAATAATHLSMAYRMMGRFRAARAAVDWAIDRLEVEPRPPQLGWAYLALGNLLLEIGTDRPAARVAYGQALTVMRAIGDRVGEGNVLICLAQSMRRDELYEEMTVRYQEAAAILTEVSDSVGLCMVEIALGRAYLRAGDLEAARKHSEKGLLLAQNSHFPQGLKDALDLSGEVALRSGDLGLALERLTGAVSKSREINGTIGLASALFHLAQVHAALGDNVAAVETGRESLALYRSLVRDERHVVADWLETVEPTAG